MQNVYYWAASLVRHIVRKRFSSSCIFPIAHVDVEFHFFLNSSNVLHILSIPIFMIYFLWFYFNIYNLFFFAVLFLLQWSVQSFLISVLSVPLFKICTILRLMKELLWKDISVMLLPSINIDTVTPFFFYLLLVSYLCLTYETICVRCVWQR